MTASTKAGQMFRWSNRHPDAEHPTMITDLQSQECDIYTLT